MKNFPKLFEDVLVPRMDDLSGASSGLVRMRFREEVLAVGNTRLPEEIVEDIDATLWAQMTGEYRYYHSAMHVLAMFREADARGWELNESERWAILFHDAVYVPGAPHSDNEKASADLLNALVGSQLRMFVGYRRAVSASSIIHSDLTMACSIIHDTAGFMQNKAPECSHRVLDLDLAGFAASRRAYDYITESLRLEAQVGVEMWGKGFSRRGWLEGRRHFLQRLFRRGRLYYVLTDLEAPARANIRREIEEIERELASD